MVLPLTTKIPTILKEAEGKIQKIILELDEELREMAVCVGHVKVDTRRWANMSVEILIEHVGRR